MSLVSYSFATNWGTVASPSVGVADVDRRGGVDTGTATALSLPVVCCMFRDIPQEQILIGKMGI